MINKHSKILIADDVEMNRELLCEILGEGKYEFVYACDGTEVVSLLSAGEAPDLILLDLNMPNMDGFEVLRVMNERHWIEEFPVIIISAEDGADFITKAYQLGAADYISRPFRAVVVQRRIENTMLVYSNQKRLIRLLENEIGEREKTNNAMINIFSNVIELRNHESGSHTLNVQCITSLLLRRLVELTDRYSLTKTDISMISSLAALHDIGKIKIPEEILNKPGKLTEEEWVLMKTHTTEGDKLLADPALDQSSQFIKTARCICRWHHEKYDGRGYPDGLVGDEIPIAAQVVSMADAYDALTSERCYKKAFSHEKAMDMILNGECGVYNPLLLRCLSDVSDSLKDLMQSGTRYDYQGAAINIANEVLAKNDLPQDNAMRSLVDSERVKKEFFMEHSGGFLFEYDRLIRKVTFVYPPEYGTPAKKVTFFSRDSADNILPLKFWDALREGLHQTTRDNPDMEADVELKVNGELIPCHAYAMALWPRYGKEYTCVLGQILPIRK